MYIEQLAHNLSINMDFSSSNAATLRKKITYSLTHGQYVSV